MAYYNDYGVQYRGEFDSIPMHNGQSDNFQFLLRKKNTPANIRSVLCGKSPIVHEWMSDEPITPIKGSQLELTLLNIDNALPLSTFYSESDDDWMIEVYSYHNTGTSIEEKILFRGYLVQEDCIEEFSDIGHEIKLSFTDNLGLLKDIKFIDALKIVPKTPYDFRTVFSSVYKYNDTVKQTYAFFVLTDVSSLSLTIGDTMIIEGTPFADGIYTINYIDLIAGPGYAKIYVNEPIPDLDFGTPACNVHFITPYTENILTINEIIKICLLNTGLKFYVFESNMIEEVSQTQPVDGKRIFDYVYINTNTFIDTSSSQDCYTILEKILYRFSCELYQAENAWRIIRWHELKNSGDNELDANRYNDDFEYIDRVETTKQINIGTGRDIEYGITTGIERPYKYIKHTFNYSQNDNVPYNGSLNEIGNLIRTYNVGTDIVKEYYAEGWQNIFNPSWIFTDRYIRTISDSAGSEKERYLVVGNNFSDNYRSVGSNIFEVNKDDKIKLSFEWKTKNSVPGPGIVTFAIITLYTASGTLYLDDDGNWTNTRSYTYSITGNLQDDWISMETESAYIPEDGKLFVYLAVVDANGNTETWYRNIKIEYIPYFLGVSSAKGHYHKTQIPFTIKNIEEEEIYIDDTIKNYSKGTLFLYNDENGVRKKTSIWIDGVDNTPEVKLGELITRQFQLWKDKRRIKLEGRLWSVIDQNGIVLSPNIVHKIGQLSTVFSKTPFFKYGKLSLDYKENMAEFTMYEMWQISEDGRLSFDDYYGIMKNREITYQFNYIYK